MMKEQQDILAGMLDSAESASVLLAMTTSLADENALKDLLAKQGYKFAVTELGGESSSSEFRDKTTRAIIGACLNCGVIEKNSREIHAVLHAAENAKMGYFPNMAPTNVFCKIAVVRGTGWIAVTFYGNSAVHHITNHKRLGFGIMHI
ncbi:HutP family protein [Phascolarctobacterium sp.]|uniref:HutP family protein n=1 Tax=Phascolarctobacterium sp. TaxID=2049039 RepID=UPI0030777772